MARIDPNFPFDIFSFIHRPIRELDRIEGNSFVERFLTGPQQIFEDQQDRINELKTLFDPSIVRADLLEFLKDHVGLTVELNEITQNLTENELRKLIRLAVPLWKRKGIEVGYKNIIRLFTGKGSRVFDWFDFRLIVGEKAFGEEQLGEDSWFISLVGVEGSEPVNDVVNLLTFEGNTKDRSLARNDAELQGSGTFFTTPSTGFPANSDKGIRLAGGVVVQNNSSIYNFSNDFTLEFFLRTTNANNNKTLFSKRNGSNVGILIDFDTVANSFTYTLFDGVNTVTDTLVASSDIDDGAVRHIALTVNRTDGARLWYNGSESTSVQSVATLGDVTNSGRIFLGGKSHSVDNALVDLDNFRMATNAVYDVTTATIVPPLSGFIEFIEEQLDEFQSDVRVVDDGTLNRNLTLRILNLMRPSSERLNVVFISFFDDFVTGSGNFESIQGPSATTNNDSQMVLSPGTVLQSAVLNDDQFTDIVYQAKIKEDNLSGGGVFSQLFFIQDIDNFYEFRIDTTSGTVSLHKTVSGVSSQIGSDVTEDIVAKASYIFTVSTKFNATTNETLIKTFVDSNEQHNLTDASFTEGKFGFKTNATTTIKVSEIELFQLPLDVLRIDPNFEL